MIEIRPMRQLDQLIPTIFAILNFFSLSLFFSEFEICISIKSRYVSRAEGTDIMREQYFRILRTDRRDVSHESKRLASARDTALCSLGAYRDAAPLTLIAATRGSGRVSYGRVRTVTFLGRDRQSVSRVSARERIGDNCSRHWRSIEAWRLSSVSPAWPGRSRRWRPRRVPVFSTPRGRPTSPTWTSRLCQFPARSPAGWKPPMRPSSRLNSTQVIDGILDVSFVSSLIISLTSSFLFVILSSRFVHTDA